MATASQVLTDNLKCPICQDIFNDPKVLACSHTFCTGCLVQQHRLETADGKPEDIITCASCRTPSTLPDNGIGGLPNNQVVKALVDDNEKRKDGLQECPTTSTSKGRKASQLGFDSCDGGSTSGIAEACSVCALVGFAVAEIYCQRCAQYMCGSCLDQHNRFKGNANHETASVADIQSGDVRIKRTCAQHPEEYLRHVCITCRACLCFKCRMLEHNSPDAHVVFDIADYEESQKASTEILRDKAEEKIAEMEGYIAYVDEHRSNVTQAVSKITESINDAYKEAVDDLNKTMADLLGGCRRIETDLSQKLNDIAIRNSQKLDEIRNKMGEIERSQETFMQEQTLPDESLTSDMERVLEDVEIDYMKPVELYSRATTITFNPLNTAQRAKQMQLGQLTLGPPL